MNIYQLSADYLAKLEQIAERESNGETVSHDEAIELLDLKTNVRDKIVATGKYIANRKAERDAVEEAENAFRKRKQVIDNDINRNKERLLYIMNILNIQGVKDPIMPVRRQNHAASVVVDDIELIPDDYKETVTSVKVDKRALKEALANSDIKGAHLEAGEHVRIG